MGHPIVGSEVAPPSETATCLCALCAQRGKTCCQSREIYLTHCDVVRISAHTDQSDFFEYKIPQDADYGPDPSDPIWSQHAFRADHSRRILRFDERGDCPFLTEHGCRLPLQIRPLVCRLHPHCYDHLGLCGLAHDCPEEFLRPGQDLLSSLQMSDLEAARGWHAQLYQELLQEEPPQCLSD